MELPGTDVIKWEDAQFVEIIHDFDKQTRATAHVMVRVRKTDRYGASEIFKLTALKQIAVAVNLFGDLRVAILDENGNVAAPVDPFSGFDRSVKIGLFGTSDSDFKLACVVNLLSASNTQELILIEEASGGCARHKRT